LWDSGGWPVVTRPLEVVAGSVEFFATQCTGRPDPNVFSILAATYRPATHKDNTALWQATASDTSTMHRRNRLISWCGMCGTQG
jgi:hypothetical protein